MLVYNFKSTEENFDVYCQSKDMADFHGLQGKLEPLRAKEITERHCY